MERNVLGEELAPCSVEPMTGFFRTGLCECSAHDSGVHTVCAVMTEEFLAFTKSRGNDLSTPLPEYDFPGLMPGDRWCLCAGRWMEACEAGVAPHVVLASTHEYTLEFCEFTDLLRHAVDAPETMPGH